ncbi:MAG: HD domain-containing protein, partial [Oscillospiraceae bacterium]|nr:HD domain-containing protein [Oscillospiraceae bacterium]
MTDAEKIRAAEAFLKDKLQSGSYMKAHPAELAYRIEHSYRVANIGRCIAKNEGFDLTEMTLACLLHDVAYCEDFDPETGWKNHGRRSAHLARPFLESLGFAPERVDDMCYGIAIHVDDCADFDGVHTRFAETISDADNIDRFDAYRIY